MKKAVLGLLLLAFGYTTHAQLGFSAGYSNFNFSDWETQIRQEFGSGAQLFELGSRVGVNYRLPLKDVRIEFLPSIEYATALSSSFTSTGQGQILTETYDLDIFGAYLKAKVYPFSFKADCTCPTFHQGGQFFEKGFFLMGLAGIERVATQYALEGGDESSTASNDEWRPSFGGGLGIDIGLSDFLTLSPFVTAQFSTDFDGTHLFPNAINDNGTSDLFQLFGGINLTIQLNRY